MFNLMPVGVSTGSKQGILNHHEECAISNRCYFIFENLKAFLNRKLLHKLLLSQVIFQRWFNYNFNYLFLTFFSVLAVLENSDGLLMPPLEIYLNSAQNKITLVCKHFNKLTEA